MKVYEIVAVKDELTDTFMEPRFFEKKAEAERIFTYQINNIDLWRENAEDYSLYSIGTYDQETGTIIGINPVKIIGGRAVRKEKE